MRFFAQLALVLPTIALAAAKQAVHSHNDYLQSSPFYTATALGVSSLEADVFLRDGKLLVAHTILELDSSRTLDSLYIQPILKALKDGTLPKPFQLLIDFKDDGAQTLPVVIQALAPLRDGGYLTTYASGTLTKRDVTVVGTGNTPLDGIKALTTRDIFYDAPAITVGDSAEWNVNLSPLASADFQDAIDWSFWNYLFGLYDDQRAKLAELIQKAHTKGLTTRFWNTPSVYRDEVWKDLLDAGTDWLNADDLAAATTFVSKNAA